MRHETELKIEISSFGKYHNRKFALHNFKNMKFSIASVNDLNELKRAKSCQNRANEERLCGTGDASVSNEIASSWHVTDPEGDYWPGFELISDNTFIEGYWQNENYFLDIAETICSDLAFPELPNEYNRIADFIRKKDVYPKTVGIHIRRGDYLRHDRFGPLAGSYYHKAIEFMISEIGSDLSFIVISDDQAWTRRNLNTYDMPTFFVDFPKSASCPWHDMHLLKLCRHHIVANSSFSWWGAWLAQHANNTKDGIVCAPSPWLFGKEDERFSPAPQSWIKMPSEPEEPTSKD
ncbi:MAG: alpha-1,2-fucosyltransferase [Desulfovibrio sp.]|jgi:hypothetical protein|nr:alpha-1,2-fucosyltransferase [Desulfovibrio sp.]